MATVYELPLNPVQQQVRVAFPNGVFNVRFMYCNVDEGGWIMDINDADSGDSIIAGLPLVTGIDLFAQYHHLGFTYPMWVTTDGDPDAVPTYENLGVTSHLRIYF